MTDSGIRWNYNLEGEGKETLLFIHGWGVNMLVWRQQVKQFSERYQVLSVDLPGHGKTHWQKVTLHEIAFDILSILNELAIDKVTIVGSSVGGLVGLKVFEISPNKIQRMIFVGSQPKFAKSEDYPFGLDVEKIKKLSSQVESDYPGIINIFFRSLFTLEERESRRFKWLQTFRKADVVPEQSALREWLDILEKEDLREVLISATIPMQFIYGTDDNICPRELLFYLKALMPRGQYYFFDHCGHFPFLSKPHEFNGVLENFLNSTAGK